MKELKIQRIKDGIVIDHIPPGKAFQVLRILGLHESRPDTLVLVAVNVPSKKMGRKDIVKVENRYLDESEVNRIALVAPDATLNVVKDYEVVRKTKVSIPDVIEGVLRKCPNPNCISNYEDIPTKFVLESRNPIKIRCYYCERVFESFEDYI